MNFSKFSQCLRLGMNPAVADDMNRLYKGDSGSEQTSEQDSTPYQQQYFNNLLRGADSWLAKGGFNKQYGGSANFDSVANQNQAQIDAINNSVSQGNNLQGLYNTLGNSSISNFLGTYDPSKTGLNSAIDAANNRIDWNYNTTIAPQVRQGAQDAGQYGSTRHGVAEGIALSNLSQQKLDAANTLAYQDQQAYNANQLNALNSLSNISTGLNSGNTTAYNAGTLTQQQQQNEINGQLEKWAYENNVTLNDLMAYKNLISGDMGGSSAGSVTATSNGGGGLGALASIGGSALGSYMGS